MAESSLNLSRIWRETMNRLESLDAAVQEAKRLEEALNFTRYVFWSGLLQLFDENPQPLPLKVDGAFMRWKCQELQRKVQERYRSNDGEPHIDETQLSAINRKLDLIAGHLQKFSPPSTETETNAPLRILDGGAS